MSIANKTAHAVAVCVAIVVLSGCAGSQSVWDAPTATHGVGHPYSAQDDGVSYKILFNFGKNSGSEPIAGLIANNGLLYGTTYNGRNGGGYGTVFVVDTAGLEKLLYIFKGGDAGENPAAALSKLNGVLYGTTYYGGVYRQGTVFSVTADGKEHVLHSFQGGSDGANPATKLLSLNGTLYGTTYYGGYSDCGYNTCGTVFSITTAGEERNLYSFQGGRDGANPGAYLTLANGLLYGTTYNGGNPCYCGTVFTVTTAGKEHVVYRFKGGANGAGPLAGVTKLNGMFYGTTKFGGANDMGTVFSIDTAGKQHVLYSFQGGKDGAYPEAHLTHLNSVLYGTTYGGGLESCGDSRSPTWCGTVFSVTTAGKENVLYRFTGGKDGSDPNELLGFNGTLYGTTQFGGQYGRGTVYALTP